jgi:hypothetical protein
MQELILRNLRRKQERPAGNKTRKVGFGGSLRTVVIGICVFCLCAGLLLLGSLTGTGEAIEPLQRVGLALVLIPILVLGFTLKPYENGK